MSEIEDSIRFDILGPVRIRVGTEEIRITAGRDRTVLGVLLLHAPGVVPVPRLVEAIWGERPPPNARNQVQGCVSRLRRRLADAGVRRPVVVTDRTGYRIALAPPEFDLLEFRRLRDEALAAAAAGRAAEAHDRYQAALAQWRGPALAGVGGDPVRLAAATLDDERIQAQEQRIRLALEGGAGAPGELLVEIAELVREHPYREALQAVRLRALCRTGRQADALAEYRHFRELLRAELGSEPGAELQRLHRAILNRDRSLDPPRPAPTAPATPPPAPPTPRELPAQVSGFTGRAGAMAALDDLLAGESAGAPGPMVISAIAGTAGVGKTALAVHWAHRVADRFPDGQLYLNLRGYTSGPPLRPIEALAALLRSVGTPSEQIPTEAAQAAALFRTKLANRRVLVVLDNAGSADQVRPLLPGSPGCLVLVTSRDRLGGLVARDGAQRLTLDVLTAAEAQTLLTRLLGAERAAAEPDPVADLAAACAYLPLALRIAAAHLADHPDSTVAAYVDQLTTSDRLAALQAGGDHESSVLATLNLSYQALPAETARQFRLLGLVPGPDFTPAAAAALTGTTTDVAGQHLRRLATAHLVNEHAPGRYSFHDLLRLFARQVAETDEEGVEQSAAIRRLFAHYLGTIDGAAGRLYPERLRLPIAATGTNSPITSFDGSADALAWLDSERANLIAAVVSAAAHGPRPFAWLLADSLRGYYWHRRHAVEWLTVAHAALTAAQQENDHQAQAAALMSLADRHHVCVGDYAQAVERYRDAAEHASRAGWETGQAAALSNLGIVHRVLGQLHAAGGFYAEALSAFRRSGFLPGQATVSTNLGTVYLVLGRLRQAADSHTQALALYRQIGAAGGEATALRNLGEANHHLGRMDRAYRQLTQSLALYRQVGNRSGEAATLDSLAAADRDAGRLTDAVDHATQSAALAAEIGDHQNEAVAFSTLGSVQLAMGQPDVAVSHYRTSMNLAHEGSHYHETRTLLGLAAAHYQLGDFPAAWEHAATALDHAVQSGYGVLEGQTLTLLAGTSLELGHGEARDLAGRALKSHRNTGHRLGEARTLAVLSRIEYAAGEADAAHLHRTEAATLFVEIGAPVPEELRPG